MQLPPPLKLPAPLLAQVTVPVGVLVVPPSVSVTVAVQFVDAVEPFNTSDAGEQLTAVAVERFVTVKAEVLLLVL